MATVGVKGLLRNFLIFQALHARW